MNGDCLWVTKSAFSITTGKYFPTVSVGIRMMAMTDTVQVVDSRRAAWTRHVTCTAELEAH